MPSCQNILEVTVGTFFTFKTPRLVRVRSLKIGLTFRLVQILILAYVIGVAIIYKKGYQETDKVESSVTAKVKGIASTVDRFDLPRSYRRVWDTADYVIPPQENGAFFVMTNAIITPRQRFTECAEDPSVSPCNVVSDSDPAFCPKNHVEPVGNGINTGRCVQSGLNKSCEISGWCPVEKDDLSLQERPLLPHASNFTVFIKNNIEFPKFGIKKSNIPRHVNSSYFRRCRYHPKTDPTCPIFTLGTITDAANTKFEKLAMTGGVINIGIEWDCNLDYGVSSCVPVYKFSRLDDDGGKASIGWNFRYANYYRTPTGETARDLFKVYGILFIFIVNGKAGKFSLVPLILNIGAGVALLGVATLACDFILLYVLKSRNSYQESKFLEITDEDFKKLGYQQNGDVKAKNGTSLESTPKKFNPRESLSEKRHRDRQKAVKN